MAGVPAAQRVNGAGAARLWSALPSSLWLGPRPPLLILCSAH